MSDSHFVEILLVEDNPHDLELTLRALRKANVTNRIQMTRDGAEALEFLFAEGAYSGRHIEGGPKVIFLDLKLPKIDGLEILRRVKSDSRTKTIPVVMLTSSQEQKDVVDSYSLGANSYVVKPVDYQKFSEAVSRIGLYWLSLNQPSRP